MGALEDLLLGPFAKKKSAPAAPDSSQSSGDADAHAAAIRENNDAQASYASVMRSTNDKGQQNAAYQRLQKSLLALGRFHQ